MRATGWHGGGNVNDAAGYGIKFVAADRDRFFDQSWSHVVVEIDDDSLELPLTPSFWRQCSELRSAEIGRWFLREGVAPWPKGAPPGVAVTHVNGNRFTARLIRCRSLL